MTAAGGVQWDASPETFLLLNALFDKFGCIFLEFAQLTVTAIKRWGFSIPHVLGHDFVSNIVSFSIVHCSI